MIPHTRFSYSLYDCCPIPILKKVDAYLAELEQLPVSDADNFFLADLKENITNIFFNCTWTAQINAHDLQVRTCSVTGGDIQSEHSGYYEAPLPILQRKVRVAINAHDRRALHAVDDFFRKLFSIVGPFNLPTLGLRREWISCNAYGVLKFQDFDSPCFKLPNFPEKFNICHLEIKYNPKQGCLDVVCEAVSKSIVIQEISLGEVMQSNPGFDFILAVRELPNTLGGNFIRRYVTSRISPGETY